MSWLRGASWSLAIGGLLVGCRVVGEAGSGTPTPPVVTSGDGGDGGDGEVDLVASGIHPDAATPAIEVVTYPATSLGLTAFSANGRVQPHGLPTSYYFEYGTTTSYG